MAEEDSILAVIVLYRRPLAESESFRSLLASARAAGETVDLFVYDNTPTPCDAAALPVSGDCRIVYRHDPSNPGVSKAYNEGYRAARAMGKRWLLLLDQDTLFPEESFAAYRAALAAHRDCALFAPRLVAGGRLYSPCRCLGGAGFHLKGISPGVHPFRRVALLNSGLLVSVEAFAAAGGFNETVELDFADFSFNRRLRRGNTDFVLLGVTCTHRFSDLEEAGVGEALQRFRFYCRGGRASVETPPEALFRALTVGVRCLRLSLRYRSLRFALTYLRAFLAGDK